MQHARGRVLDLGRRQVLGKDWLLYLDYSAENKALCAHPMSK